MLALPESSPPAFPQADTERVIETAAAPMTNLRIVAFISEFLRERAARCGRRGLEHPQLTNRRKTWNGQSARVAVRL
ncbi:hypothetical protein GCM10010350_68680 [Streptomyces galilaeus]|nr:hypothetical protein GCM10010350_68680 [Streptomyces galilaeus]